MVGHLAIDRGLDVVLPEYLLVEKGYDADHFIVTVRGCGITPVIPSRKNRRELDVERNRNQVERFINYLKQSRRIATRYEKTARNYRAFITLAAIMLSLASMLLSTWPRTVLI